jgi:site-specific recombinase XerD
MKPEERRWGSPKPVTGRSTSPHSCRHSFACRVLETSGGNVAVVQAALRHRSITSTMVYAKVNEASVRAALG